MCGGLKASLNSGKVQPSRSFTKRWFALTATTSERFRSLPIQLNHYVLTMVASRLSQNCEANGILPKTHGGFRPTRSAADMLFVLGRLQELGRAIRSLLCMCFIDLQKQNDFVDRQLLWVVPARCGVPEKMLTVISSTKACQLVWIRMRVSTVNGLIFLRDFCMSVYHIPYFQKKFAAAIHTVLVPFTEDPDAAWFISRTISGKTW